jgi:hypothetical protein
MKSQNLLLSALAILMLSFTAEATVWRVNNNAGVDADFNNLNTAVNSGTVVSGDTLYVEASSTNYGSFTCSKQLTIIGTGFMLDANDSTQADQNEASLNGTTYFNPGSEGSIIYGMTWQNGQLYINADNVTVIRNHFYTTSSYSQCIRIQNGHNNVAIVQNFIHHYVNTTTYYCLYFEGNNNNIFVSNNIFIRGNQTSFTSNTYNEAIYMPSSGATATYVKNIFLGYLRIYNSQMEDNIHVCGSFVGSGNNYENNISYTTTFGTLNGNQQNVTMTGNNVFEETTNGYTFDEDGFWRLSTGSPAIAAGKSGDDCGVFDGALEWKPSGIPPIPAIFDATVPTIGTPSSGINVNIKAKTHR